MIGRRVPGITLQNGPLKNSMRSRISLPIIKRRYLCPTVIHILVRHKLTSTPQMVVDKRHRKVRIDTDWATIHQASRQRATLVVARCLLAHWVASWRVLARVVKETRLFDDCQLFQLREQWRRHRQFNALWYPGGPPTYRAYTALKPKEIVQLLRGERQIRAEKDSQATQHLQHNIDRRPGCLAIYFYLFPRRLLVKVTVCLSRDSHSRIDTIFKVAIGYVMSYHCKTSFHLCQNLAIGLPQVLRMWHYASEPALQERQSAVYRVSVCCYQFVIIAPDQLLKCKVGIASLGSSHREIVA